MHAARTQFGAVEAGVVGDDGRQLAEGAGEGFHGQGGLAGRRRHLQGSASGGEEEEGGLVRGPMGQQVIGP